MTSLKTSIKTITNLSDTNCLEIHGASLHPDLLSIDYQRPMLVLHPGNHYKFSLTLLALSSLRDCHGHITRSRNPARVGLSSLCC
ncbi:hypothetical protein DNK73_28240 [Klebsiella pneumoniae]|nr:hypothetical protein DNK73_28240 [Klebsiella pneumoniae]RGC92842.1 hypothetical protein DIC67_19905 [Klebsiella pneumoniae]